MQELERPMEILTESVAVPFDAINRAIDSLPYASTLRVMFEMLVLTGCRIEAMDKMRIGMIQNGTLYYHPGKKQKQYLKTDLPQWYLVELTQYRQENRLPADCLFGVNANSFRRYFTKARNKMPSEWQEKVKYVKNNNFESGYRLQLKGIRKVFWTYEFKRALDEWKSADMALEVTSKKAAHSTTHMTAYHYLREFDTLGLKIGERLKTVSEIMTTREQRSLLEFGISPNFNIHH